MKKLIIIFAAFFILSKAQAASAPEIQTGNIYHKNVDLENYLVSEKLDGIRARWDGKNLISRQGNIINALKWFTQNFPSQLIDGELWISRNQFELVSGIVRTQIPDESGWKKVKFMVFDLPANKEIFANRYEEMKKLANAANSPYLQIIEQSKIANHTALMQRLNLVVKNGGEGLMLHRATSIYKAARSDDILKVKTYEDAEATVISYVGGQGKYKNMMGALMVENKDKIRFKIGGGFSDEQRKNPPKIGSVITYKYYGLTKNNIPRFASFIRIREDF